MVKLPKTCLGYGNVGASASGMGEQPAEHAKHYATDLEMLHVSDLCTLSQACEAP